LVFFFSSLSDLVILFSRSLLLFLLAAHVPRMDAAQGSSERPPFTLLFVMSLVPSFLFPLWPFRLFSSPSFLRLPRLLLFVMAAWEGARDCVTVWCLDLAEKRSGFFPPSLFFSLSRLFSPPSFPPTFPIPFSGLGCWPYEELHPLHLAFPVQALLPFFNALFASPPVFFVFLEVRSQRTQHHGDVF